MNNIADILGLCLMGVSALWGLSRGFAREVFSLAAWAGAFIAATKVAPLLLPWLSGKISDPLAAQALAYIVAFIVLLIIFSSVAQRFASTLRTVLVGGIDRLLGGFFGVLRGYIILVVLYVLSISMVGETTTQYLIAESKIAPYILAGVHVLGDLTPYFPKLHLAMPPATGHEAAF